MNIIVKKFEELTNREVYEILKSRQDIFVVEQNCTCEDIDRKDYESIHVFIKEDDGTVSACLRVFTEDNNIARIGRVITLYHGRGLGRMILHEGVNVAENIFHADKIIIHSQTYAVGFYAKEGFEIVSEEFIEDGIPHVKMERIRR